MSFLSVLCRLHVSTLKLFGELTNRTREQTHQSKVNDTDKKYGNGQTRASTYDAQQTCSVCQQSKVECGGQRWAEQTRLCPQPANSQYIDIEVQQYKKSTHFLNNLTIRLYYSISLAFKSLEPLNFYLIKRLNENVKYKCV